MRIPLGIRLLARLLPRQDREVFLGDLQEEYQEHVLPRVGKRAAGRWLWRMALGGIAAGVGDRVRTSVRRQQFRYSSQQTDPGAPGHSGFKQRRAQGVNFMSLLRELPLALRRWTRTPVLAVVLVMSIALGIGANAAVFSVFRAVVLSPYDLPHLDRLMVLTRANPEQGREGWPVPPQEFRDWRDLSTSFADMAAAQMVTTTITGEGAASRHVQANVTSNFFDLLERSPRVGRGFASEEMTPDRSAVVVLSDGLWRSRFGADPGVIGRTIQFDGVAKTVIGIAPEELAYPENVELWAPLALAEATNLSRTFHTLTVVGRLGADASRETAQADMDRVALQLERDYPDSNSGERSVVTPLAEAGLGTLASSLLTVFAGAGLVLLLTCVNISVLLYVRSLRTARDQALRAAMGADRMRVALPVIADVGLLGVVGMVAGLGLAQAFVSGILASTGDALPHMARVGMTPGVILFVVGLTAFACLLFGLLPTLRAFQTGAAEVLRSSRSGLGRRGVHVRRGLIALEMAVALITLVGAGLMLRTFASYASVDTGIDPGDAIVFKVTLPGSAYPDADAQRDYYARLYAALDAVPGVRSAGGSAWLPWMGGVAQVNYTLEGMGELPEAERPVGYFQTVSDGFMAAAGLDVLEGRGFDGTDRPDTERVAVVTPAFVQAHGLEGRALGSVISIEIGDPSVWEKTIVGVVEEVPMAGLDQEALPSLYTPAEQFPWGGQEIIVRTQGGPMVAFEGIRNAVASVDINIPAYDVTTLDALLGENLAQPRLQMRLLGLFGVLALMLAVVGAYGVLSFVVTSRHSEIGVRLAVGATPGLIYRLMFVEGLTSVAAGAVVGLSVSWVTVRSLQGLLFGVEARDPVVFGAALLFVIVAGVLAAALPSYRATTVRPQAALRSG